MSSYRMFKRFRRSEDGGVLVENVMWLPVMFALFVMAADASILFMNKARITNVMQEAGRRMAVGELQDCAGLTAWLESNTRLIAETSSVTQCVNDTASATVSVVQVSAPSGELLLSGAASLFGRMTVNVRVLYHKEVG